MFVFRNIPDVLRDPPERGENFEYHEDIKVGGERIQEKEKSPEQKKIVEKVFSVINKHLRKIGVPEYKVDEKRIIFSDDPAVFSPFYDALAHVIVVPTWYPGMWDTLLHEGLHMVTSDWKRKGKEATIQSNKKGEKMVLGVDTLFFEDAKEKDIITDMKYRDLNEGLTERITRDLIDQYRTDFEALEKEFETEKKTELAKFKKEYEKEKKQIQYDVKSAVNNILKETEEEVDYKKEKYKQEKAGIIKRIRAKISAVLRKRKAKKTAKKIKKSQKYELKWMNEDQKRAQKEIEKKYSLDEEDEIAYQEEQRLVELLIDGLEKLKRKQGVPPAAARESAWEDFQKAFFMGDGEYLQVFEEIFGKGALSKINNYSQFGYKQQEKYFKELEQRLKENKE